MKNLLGRAKEQNMRCPHRLPLHTHQQQHKRIKVSSQSSGKAMEGFLDILHQILSSEDQREFHGASDDSSEGGKSHQRLWILEDETSETPKLNLESLRLLDIHFKDLSKDKITDPSIAEDLIRLAQICSRSLEAEHKYSHLSNMDTIDLEDVISAKLILQIYSTKVVANTVGYRYQSLSLTLTKLVSNITGSV